MDEQQLINKIIKDVDNRLKNYAIAFNKEKIDFETQSNNKALLCNERTLSTTTNKILEEVLSSVNINPLLVVNEFEIKLKNKITDEKFEEIKSKINNKVKLKENNWKNCFVDGYFKFNCLGNTNSHIHVFIEYKMSNTFDTLELAKDFLKYKIYTHHSDNNTIFAFVIFNKDELYPTILNNEKQAYSIIQSESINKESIKDSKIFIYKESNEFKLDQILETYIHLDECMRDIDTYVQLEEKITKNISDENKIYIKYMKKFNTKVLLSNTIRRYYPFMKDLWEKCNTSNIFDNLSYIFGEEDGSDLPPEDLIKEGVEYRNRLTEAKFIEGKSDSLDKGYRTSINVSLFIVALFDYFNEKYNLGIKLINLKKYTIGNGKNKILKDEKVALEHFKADIKEHYEQIAVDGERKCKKLVYSMLFYINKIYPIIFDIDNNNEVAKLKPEFLVLKVIDELDNQFSKIAKLCNFKYENIDIEKIDTNDQNTLNKLKKFAFSIIEKYI